MNFSDSILNLLFYFPNALVMPAKATLFDLKCEPLFDFGTGPRNDVFYNPQGNNILTDYINIIMLITKYKGHTRLELLRKTMPRSKTGKHIKLQAHNFDWELTRRTPTSVDKKKETEGKERWKLNIWNILRGSNISKYPHLPNGRNFFEDPLTPRKFQSLLWGDFIHFLKLHISSLC